MHIVSGGIRTHAVEMTGALNQRLRPLGDATDYTLTFQFPCFWASVQRKVKNIHIKIGTTGSGGIRTHAIEMTGALNQRLRPLGDATDYTLMFQFPTFGPRFKGR